jgi:hypothetical protein
VIGGDINLDPQFKPLAHIANEDAKAADDNAAEYRRTTSDGYYRIFGCTLSPGDLYASSANVDAEMRYTQRLSAVIGPSSLRKNSSSPPCDVVPPRTPWISPALGATVGLMP